MRAFTLIEILVVLIIIGITTTFAFLALGDFGASRKAEAEAQNLVAFIKLVEEKAVIEMNSYGILLSPKGYQLLALNNQSVFVLSSRSPLFRFHAFANKVVVTPFFKARPAANQPQIQINPSGEITPFVLYFGTEEKPKQIKVEGFVTGDVQLIREKVHGR